MREHDDRVRQLVKGSVPLILLAGGGGVLLSKLNDAGTLLGGLAGGGEGSARGE